MVVFKTRTEFENTIFRRARAVMGLRGVNKPENARICTNVLRKHHALEYTEEVIADIAKEVAEDTIYYGIEYFR